MVKAMRQPAGPRTNATRCERVQHLHKPTSKVFAFTPSVAATPRYCETAELAPHDTQTQDGKHLLLAHTREDLLQQRAAGPDDTSSHTPGPCDMV
jgi:hypothetical protein